jgi:hypothetical protein
MGCQTCGQRAASAAAQFPRDVVMPDGTTVNVTSAADERTQRERYKQRERAAAKTKGYTVSR